MKTLSDLEKMALASLQKREKQYALRVQKQFAETLKSIRGDMAKIYEKYAVDGKLTRAEMTRYNKYITMEKQITSLLDPAIKNNIKEIRRLGPDMYNASFFQHAWAMDNGNGVRLSWGLVNTKAVMETFEITNPKNIELMNALKNYGPNAKKYIRGALLTGLSKGATYNSMVAQLRKALNKSYADTLRIVRTEGQRAMSRGQDDAYLRAKEKGIEGDIIWDATLDGGTRPTHRLADGQVKKDGYFTIGGNKAQYPLDPNLPAEESINCRCRERFQVAGYSPQLRRSRDQGIIPYQNYDEWKKNYDKSVKPVVKAATGIKGALSGTIVTKPTIASAMKPSRTVTAPSPIVSGPSSAFVQPVSDVAKFGPKAPKEFAQVYKNNTAPFTPENIPLHYDVDRSEMTKTYNELKDYMEKSVPAKAIHLPDLEKVLQSNGRIYNQFTTGTSDGAISKESRDMWENAIANSKVQRGKVKIGSMQNEDRPKYASMLNFNKFNKQFNPAEQYGNHFIVYKNDVLNRSTFTLGNSSRMQGAFTKDSIQSAFVKSDSWENSSTYGFNTVKRVVNNSMYLEVQTWGNLGFDDVAKIIIDKDEIVSSAIPNLVQRIHAINPDILVEFI